MRAWWKSTTSSTWTCFRVGAVVSILLISNSQAFVPLPRLSTPPTATASTWTCTTNLPRHATDSPVDSQDTTSTTTTKNNNNNNNNNNKKHVIVVGGGWAGFSAADALAAADLGEDQDLHITLLEASPRGNQGGLAGGWRTPQGRPVEAGIHGFWRGYQNTFAVLDRLGLSTDTVLTPYTPSALFSAKGPVAVAPVMKHQDEEDETDASRPSLLSLVPTTLAAVRTAINNNNNQNSPMSRDILKPLAALLPVPLDLAVLAEFPPSSPLSLTDRLSALGLLGAWADFGQEDGPSWNRYDALSAQELFLIKAGVTPTLYEELVLPLLHVLPMCPGYDCSAAVSLLCKPKAPLMFDGVVEPLPKPFSIPGPNNCNRRAK